MLVLIAGITGMCGQPLARAALSWGHQVRGMGRNPDKLADDISSKLESFVTVKGLFDSEGLDKAVKRVDAVICAYSNMPEMVVGGQLALLYAAEKAGVKIFHAASWNYDWADIQFGEHENYDAYNAFRRTAEISSSIKPIYGFTGHIMEYAWCYNLDRNPVNPKERTVSYYGDGTEPYIWTTVDNLADYSIAAITEPTAAEGGVYHVESFRASSLELGKIYSETRGVEITKRQLGDMKSLERKVQEARDCTPIHEWDSYVWICTMLLTNKGKMIWEKSVDSERWSDRVKQTSAKTWFEQHPDV